MQSRKLRVFILLGVVLFAGTVRAETYRVDLIVFRFLGPAGEAGLPLIEGSDAGNAIELKDTAKLGAAGISLLPDAEFGLGPEWASLRSSREFRPMMKLAWTQKDPPTENGPRLRIRAGAKLGPAGDPTEVAGGVSEIDGSVGLLLSRYLHLDANLTFNEPGESPQSWRLLERRRMRRDELHHLDSPRVGLLARVSKVESSE